MDEHKVLALISQMLSEAHIVDPDSKAGLLANHMLRCLVVEIDKLEQKMHLLRLSPSPTFPEPAIPLTVNKDHPIFRGSQN